MENQKSNIPRLIIGVFVSFAIFIGYMVYQAFQSDVNLTRDDYYQNSTLHDEHVKDIERSNNKGLKLFFDRNQKAVIFETPDNFDDSKVKGEILFYRPSDGKLDFNVPINLTSNKQLLSTEKIIDGKWITKVSFTYNNENYFKESSFFK